MVHLIKDTRSLSGYILTMTKKLLIIRFSSFGDIIFCRSLLTSLKDESWSTDWLVRSDLAGALGNDENLNHCFRFDRKDGLLGLIRMSFELRKNNYDVIYDAHNNIRSLIVRFIVSFFSRSRLIIRPKDRLKRFLLFKLRINKFPSPFKAMESYWWPLKKALSLTSSLKPINWPQKPGTEEWKKLKKSIVLAPATAWPMKSWPVGHWKRLIELLPQESFILLGGPADTFCEDIASVASDRVENWAGRFSLAESCAHAAHARFIITGDTGLQQVADLAGVSGLSLIGPTAFGFPTMGSLKVLEVDLPCRPCTKDGRGNCHREIYQECMVAITPDRVAQETRDFLNNS